MPDVNICHSDCRIDLIVAAEVGNGANRYEGRGIYALQPSGMRAAVSRHNPLQPSEDRDKYSQTYTEVGYNRLNAGSNVVTYFSVDKVINSVGLTGPH